MSDFLPTILATSYTKSDILRRIHLLRGFLESVHFKKSSDTLRDYLVSKNASKEDIDILSQWNVQPKGPFGKADVYKTIESLLGGIKNLPIMTLFVPFEPDGTAVEKIGSWVRKELSPQSIVDLRLDPDAVGGARLAWNGTYGDYSLSRILQQEKATIRALIEKRTVSADQK